jgi:hypothetical protein
MTQKETPSGQFNPMGMMQKMMGQMSEAGMNPVKMCEMMTTSVARTAEVAAYATPELRGLFDDWIRAVTDDVQGKIEAAEGAVGLESLAEDLGMTVSSIAFLVSRLAVDGKAQITVSKPDEPSEAAADQDES